MKNVKGITLISLVITIVVLIILASVAINMTLGENGIITKAQEAKKIQIVAEAKEKIGTEILAAQVEAVERNEELEQAQIEDIISKYGELQADGDTIILNDNGYEVSLLEIYNGTATSTGSYSELKAKVALLEQQLEDATKNQSDASKELSDLKTLLAQTTATEAQILKDYTAYKDGKLITGTMENYAGTTQDAALTNDDTYTYLSIPNAGYYGIDSKLRTENSNLSVGISYIADTPSINIPKGIKEGIFVHGWASNDSPGYPAFSGTSFVEQKYLGNYYSSNGVTVSGGLTIYDLKFTGEEGKLNISISAGRGDNIYHYALFY